MFPIHNKRELFDILREYDAFRAAEVKEPEHITFSEAMQILGIKHSALASRIEKAGIQTRRFGKGKAFDRKYLNKLK